MNNEIKLKELKVGELFTVHQHNESIYQVTGRTYNYKDYGIISSVCRKIIPYMEENDLFLFNYNETLVSPVEINIERN